MGEYADLFPVLAASWKLLKRPKPNTGFCYAHFKGTKHPPYLMIDKLALAEKAASTSSR